jgi:NAD(P)-dependent dehydrogenase (short-subunit alcohol dehydrogenase family)
MTRLAGKVAVIAGGGTGIGLATAQRFADEGAHVFTMGRRRSELGKAKSLIGDRLTTVVGDVTNNSDLDALSATARDAAGSIDILVANSGRAETELLGAVTEENFDATFTVNTRAALFTVQKALPLIRTGGSVNLIGSTAGYLGLTGYSAYSASKAALRSYVRTWTRESGDRGIRFTLLSPGPSTPPCWTAKQTKQSSLRQCHSTDWVAPRRSPLPHCSWHPTTAVSSAVSS